MKTQEQLRLEEFEKKYKARNQLEIQKMEFGGYEQRVPTGERSSIERG